MIDILFLLAMAALGWGTSLATYRLFARRNRWPMGALHADLPLIPVIIGLFAMLVALAFAAFRGPEYGGWIIVATGLLLALFWTGFLRVGSQVSLFLAPVATALLLFGWLAVPLGFQEQGWAHKTPGELLQRRPLEPDEEPRRN
ncbi:MAG: hypothetical protein NW205_00195 [Hyphomicrobiaceae bacterium]|nr:hypothetical protein [Hyphomicrobiaceae bacterium]